MRIHRSKSQSLLLFCLAAPAASPAVVFEFQSNTPTPPSQITVAGTFCDWDKQTHALSLLNGVYSIELPLADGEYAYKFYLTDANGNDYWALDPANAFYWPDEDGHINNYLRVTQGTNANSIEGLEPFQITAPSAADVQLAGDFNHWVQGNVPLHRDTDGVWRCWVKTRRPITYRFIVDDIWRTEEVGPGIQQRYSGYEESNNFRPALALQDPDDWTSEDADADHPLPPIDSSHPEQALEEARRQSAAGDYAGAVRVCRAVAKGAREDSVKVQGLYAEAEVHRKFGFDSRAAKAWESIVQVERDPANSRQATYELAKYRVHVERDFAAGRVLLSGLLGTATDARVRASILGDIGFCYKMQRDYAAGRAAYESALEIAPPPTADDNAWAHFWTEALTGHGACCWYVKDLPAARDSFERVIEISPWPNSQNVQFAKKWIHFIDEMPEMAGSSYQEHISKGTEEKGE